MLNPQSIGMTLMPGMIYIVISKPFTCLRVILFLCIPGVKVQSTIDSSGQLARPIESQLD